jgi:hypothetical protein
MAKPRINLNPALTTSFKLDIPGFDEVNYFVQSTELPSVMMGGIDTPYQNHQTNVPSNRIEFDPINFNFFVDEDFANYEKLFFWMVDVTRTEPVIPTMLKNITLHITNSSKNHKVAFRFHQAYPTMLSALPLDSGVTDPTPTICSASFRYQYFEIIRDAIG